VTRPPAEEAADERGRPAEPAVSEATSLLSETRPMVITVVEAPPVSWPHLESESAAPEALVANGPAAATVLAAGVGAAVLGAIVTAEGISVSLSKALIFVQPVGPLSGKTTVAMVGWLLAWAFLHLRWRDREVDFRAVTWATYALVALGVLLTFPPGFDGVRDLVGGH
jgi:hypothetical protein